MYLTLSRVKLYIHGPAFQDFYLDSKQYTTPGVARNIDLTLQVLSLMRG